jgi:hypothetical protein
MKLLYIAITKGWPAAPYYDQQGTDEFLDLSPDFKMDLLEIGVNVVDWIGMAQDRYRWRALVNSVMNLRVP